MGFQMTDKEYRKWKKSLSEKQIKERYPDIAEELIFFRKNYPKQQKEITELRTVYQKLHARVFRLEEVIENEHKIFSSKEHS